jgi:hypothetical protein
LETYEIHKSHSLTWENIEFCCLKASPIFHSDNVVRQDLSSISTAGSNRVCNITNAIRQNGSVPLQSSCRALGLSTTEHILPSRSHLHTQTSTCSPFIEAAYSKGSSQDASSRVNPSHHSTHASSPPRHNLSNPTSSPAKDQHPPQWTPSAS